MERQEKIPNVLIITIDSLRPDYLGCYSQWAKEENLSPHIDKWAGDAVVFESTITQGPRTPESFPALLSGQYMTRYRDAFKGLSNERKLISEILKEQGYFTAAFNSNPYISRFSHYDRGFDIFVDNIFRAKGGIFTKKILIKYAHLKGILGHPYMPAEKLNDQVFNVLRNIGRPYFVWIHYMDVHGPYIAKKGLRIKNILRGGFLWRKATHTPEKLAPKEKKELIRTYKEEVRYNDFNIGRMLSEIDKEDNLTILTSDHGELLGEHGLFAHIPSILYDELLKVPLIIKPPSDFPIQERRLNREVKLLDIVPTILDILRIEHHFEFDGESLVPLVQGNSSIYKSDYIISEIWTKFLSVRKGIWKLTADFTNSRKKLYNLSSDPFENNNISEQRPEIVEELENIIRNHLLSIKAPAEDIEKCGFDHDEATKAQLKALGYL